MQGGNIGGHCLSVAILKVPIGQVYIMDISKFTAGKWLKAADLQGQSVQLQINGATPQNFEGDERLTINFTGKDQGMVLNMTNINTIAEAYGYDSDGWIGKTIEVYPTQVQFGSKMVDAVRIRIPQAPAIAAQPVATPPETTPPAAQQPPAESAPLDAGSIPF